ncbi:MAG: hypothetical protein ACYCZB_18005 [Acidiphilium sp.]
MEKRTPIADFVWIVQALRRVIAECGLRGAFGPRDNGIARAINLRIGRLASRFTSLVARFEAGTLAPPRKRAPHPVRESQAAAPSPVPTPPSSTQPSPRPRPILPHPILPHPILPRRLGFVAEGGYEIRGHAAQLAHWLTRPDIETLIAADSRFGRALRPLCQMLRIAPPPCLRLSPRPRKPRPRKPRPHKPHPQATWRLAAPKAPHTQWLPPRTRAPPAR